MLHWDDLRYFLAIARTGSLSGAARELGVNHSTVFRRLHGLEENLGTRLFERFPTGYVLTAAGADMLEVAKDMEEQMYALEQRMFGRDYRLSGTIRLATTDSLAVCFLQPYLRGFHDRYPNISLELVSTTQFFDLSKREADVALSPDEQPTSQWLGRQVANIAWSVYGSGDYLKARPQPQRPEDLTEHRLIDGDDSLAGSPASLWLRAQVGQRPVTYRANGILTQLAAVKAGFGLAVLPCFCADSEANLVRVLPPIDEIAQKLRLLTHSDLRRTARIHAFREYMAEAIGRDKWRLAGKSAITTPGEQSTA
ncbi:MAG: LysR family transcriptional regulator [Gammaproteobacteria bacterium]|nr:LysR family transcriptional regulator [Gammaproteobacteria bacterium]